MSDVFENVVLKFKNSPSALVLFLASVIMLIIGANHFAEDTYSSYLGLKSVEQHFNMNVQIFDWTYWTMSLAPQIASVVFFYIYLANTNKGWALWISFGSQFVDFLADLWYRSNGAMFTEWNVTIASALITFSFFTIGSEVFLTFGAGLCLKLAAPALHAWKYYRLQIEKVREQFQRGNLSKSYSETDEKNRFEPKQDRFSGFGGKFGDKLPKSGKRTPKFNLHGVNTHQVGRNLNKYPLSDEELQEKIDDLGYMSDEKPTYRN